MSSRIFAVLAAVSLIFAGSPAAAQLRPTGVIAGYFVSGTVTAGGAGLEGVLVTIDVNPSPFGAFSVTTATTDSSGSYSVYLTVGSYLVTPSKTDYTFTPVNRTVNVTGNVTGVDFTAESSVPGCGAGSPDGDSDGTPDCAESCASDPAKTTPGICGCGTADSDLDGDQVEDCIYEGGPLACGEAPTVLIGQRLEGDNAALGRMVIAQSNKLKKLVKAVSNRYGGEEGDRLAELVAASARLAVKVKASTRDLIARFPVVLVPCPGNEGTTEVSNADEKAEMRANTLKLLKMGQRVLGRLLFYQAVRNPLKTPSAKQIAKFRADRRQSENQMKALYDRVLGLVDKVPDTTRS